MLASKKHFLLLFSPCLYIVFWTHGANAFIALDDHLIAEEACEALQSIRSGANPGNIRLTPQTTYPVIGKNREDASHYLLRITGAEPSTRWVPIQCGRLANSPALGDQAYLLALSWQPSFCETKPDKPECQSQTAQRFDATHLVLHGLWPQPRQNVYCGVDQKIIQLDTAQRWLELPPIDLSEETQRELAIKMPGFASGLHLHEWYKHGTCYSNSPEEYFQESIALLDQVNNSSVRDLLTDNIGQFISASQIRQQFDAAFQNGTGNKIQVQCQKDIDEDRNDMVVELQINLGGDIQIDTPIANLLQAGQVVPAGCPLGEVDPAGFN